jgi:hypothetical protein
MREGKTGLQDFGWEPTLNRPGDGRGRRCKGNITMDLK